MLYQSLRLDRFAVLILNITLGITLASFQMGCNSPDVTSNATDGSTSTITDVGGTPVQAPPSPTRAYSTDAMVYAGTGTWATEVTNLETVLRANGASYQEVNGAELDAMAPVDLAKFGVLIFPGGSGSQIAEGLSVQTHSNLRDAVQVLGVSYLGFCAGAFIAVAPAPANGQDVSYGFGIVNGPILNAYYLDGEGIDIAMTLDTFPGGTTKDLLWYGGPVTPNTAGSVVAKYPTGDPAITEVRSGAGFVIMSGVHPTADQATLAALGMTSTDGVHQDYAWQLISAAQQGAALPTF